MVFLFIPVGTIISAFRSEEKNNSQPPQQQRPIITPKGSAPILKNRPRLIVVDDGIQVNQEDLYMLNTGESAIPSNARTAIVNNTLPASDQYIQLQSQPSSNIVKSSSSTSYSSTTSNSNSSSEPYYIYYNLLNPTGEIFYTAPLKIADNTPDVTCQLCVPSDECPLMSSCDFAIKFNTQLNTVNVSLPPLPSPPPSPVIVSQPSKTSFFSSIVKSVNTAVSSRSMQSQEIVLSYVQSANDGPVQQVMDLNAAQSMRFASNHTDCCCILVWCHFLTKSQKHVGVQIVALPKSEGEKQTQEWASCWKCTAC